jgi:hypothetical protein
MRGLVVLLAFGVLGYMWYLRRFKKTSYGKVDAKPDVVSSGALLLRLKA